VKVFDIGLTDQGRPYLVMEFLDGETLDTRLSRLGTLPPYSTALILRLAARALDSAHALGIVHRDFKPENIILLDDTDGLDNVKVVDFGVAKLLRGFDESELEGAASPERVHARGRLVGTPFYMAPEQTRAEKDVYATLDVWAMGVVAYECLTGRRPFVGRDMQTLFDRIQNGEHPLAHEVNPALPTTFEDWFRTACHPEPRNRFQSASVAATALIEALDIQTSSFPSPDGHAASSPDPCTLSSHSVPDSFRTQRGSLSVPFGPGHAPRHTVSATLREPRVHSVLPGSVACPEELPMGYRSRPTTEVSAAPPVRSRTMR